MAVGACMVEGDVRDGGRGACGAWQEIWPLQRTVRIQLE